MILPHLRQKDLPYPALTKSEARPQHLNLQEGLPMWTVAALVEQQEKKEDKIPDLT